MNDCRITAKITQPVISATVVEQNIVATLGAPRGAPGPVGPPGQVKDFVFAQASPATLWNINHNLDRKPLIQILTVGGLEMFGDVLHLSDNQLQVSFVTAVAGSARLL